MKEFYLYTIFIVILIAAICTTAILIKKHEEKRLGDFQDKILKKQRDEVQNIYATMREWRHDYHNHIQTIKAHLSMGQINEILPYLAHLEEDLDSIDIAVRTGNVGMDAILSSKISIAAKNNITVNYKAAVPDKLTVTDIHLCAIVGNLLDNAVEACEHVAPQNRFIRVYIGIFKQQLYISVSNSTNSTKRKKISEFISGKQGEHGLGLKRINRIVDLYGGFINRKNEPGIFATEIMLPL